MIVAPASSSVRGAHGLHRIEGRAHDFIHHSASHRGRHYGCGRVSAHAARVGSEIAIEYPLVVLRRNEGNRSRAVAKREKRSLLAGKKLLDDQFRAGGAQSPPASIMSIAASASPVVPATTTPFPAASPSAFTTIGAPLSLT